MSISAMKQALDLLETSWGCGHQETLDRWNETIEVLYEAIEQAEKQEPVAIGEEWKPCVKLPVVVHVREQRKGETHVSTREGITPVKEDDLIMRGVAGEEYPIGRELFNRTYTFDTAPVHASDISQERVDETAKDQHEPVAWITEWNGKYSSGKVVDWVAHARGENGKHTPLYTAPPKREWVGLTDEEVGGLTVFNGLTHIEVMVLAAFVRVIEAKLKEKNCQSAD